MVAALKAAKSSVVPSPIAPKSLTEIVSFNLLSTVLVVVLPVWVKLTAEASSTPLKVVDRLKSSDWWTVSDTECT